MRSSMTWICRKDGKRKVRTNDKKGYTQTSSDCEVQKAGETDSDRRKRDRKTEYINSREDKTKRRKEKNEARCGGVLGEMRKQKRC